MTEVSKIIRKYRKGIKLDAGEIYLLKIALKKLKFNDHTLEVERQKLLKRIEGLARRAEKEA